MKDNTFFKIELDQADFVENKLQRAKKNICLPQRNIPPKFEIAENNFYCGGYFMCYDNLFGQTNLIQTVKSKNWSQLLDSTSDFFIFYIDYVNNEVFIITDQFGKFPCFYSKNKYKFFLSNSFGQIKNDCKKVTIDKGSVIDFIAWNQLPTTETVLKEVKTLPPAVLLKISSNFELTLTSLMKTETFLNQDYQQYSSIEAFAVDFLSLFKKIIIRSLKAIKSECNLASDISSGFDSTLICYLLKELADRDFEGFSGISNETFADTDPFIVKKFAKKHGLKVNFIDENYYYPLATRKDKNLIRNYPSQSPLGLMNNYHNVVDNAGFQFLFKGEGGDELYRAFLLDDFIPYRYQQAYFQTVRQVKLKIDKVLSDKGLSILLDRKRFQKKEIFPTILAYSNLFANQIIARICWPIDLWFFTPYSDLKLINFARGIPRREGKPFSKQEVWKNHDEIFIPEQFIPKGGPEEKDKLLLKKDASFVLNLLKNSVLAEKKWIKRNEIVDNIRAGNFEEYYQGDALIYLVNLLKLEYFLQENQIY